MSEQPDPHLAAYIADRDRKIRDGWFVNHSDLAVLATSINKAAFHLRDNARPGSELAGFVEPLFRLAEIVFDSTEAIHRRKHAVDWPTVYDFVVEKGRRSC